MDEIEDFDTLLAGMPRYGAPEWRAAALRELRGAALESIAVELDEGLAVSPYAVPTPGRPVEFPPGRGLVLADLHEAAELAEADLLTELEGGAQGLWLPEDSGTLNPVDGIRFDYLTTVFPGAATALRCVPEPQRQGAGVWVPSNPERAAATLTRLQRDFPGGAVVFELDSRGGPIHVVRAGMQVLRTALAVAPDPRALADGAILRLPLRREYPLSLVELQAIKLAWRKVLLEVGVSEPLPPPRLWGTVPASADGQTAEDSLIDASTRAVAAMTAGVEALSVAAYPGIDPVAARRRARNVAVVLQIEAGLAQGADVLAGAAWVERAATEVLERSSEAVD